jgi:hypothetical protein
MESAKEAIEGTLDEVHLEVGKTVQALGQGGCGVVFSSSEADELTRVGRRAPTS